MLNELFTNHGSVIILSTIILLVFSGLISSRKRYRKERPDPPIISAHIHGMYVCYQCDTIFNTPQCPECNEEAVIPLIRLTGSILENEGIAAVMGKLQERSTWKLPTFQDRQAVAPASGSEVYNGGASEVPVTIEVITPERNRELS